MTTTLSHSIPFRRLLLVEARKLVDTRGGVILTGVLVFVSAALVVGRGVVVGPPKLLTLASTASIGLGYLLPVLAILTVTAEWSHRTALTTFTLEPRRGRVVAAKSLSALAATVLACLFSLLIAVPATAISAAVLGEEPTWQLAPQAFLGWIAVLLIMTAEGLALGLLLLNAPAAIVICLVNTMVWPFVRLFGDLGKTLADWVDLGGNTDVLFSGDWTGDAPARLAVSGLVWVVVPMAAGLARVLRAEVH
ncbi:ABC transporter permease [Nonomuraea insulae]|uniref:ABC transporter permease n=1 Tax=Nonomuraea insulae TaxID=1616787 RepID=A0ABW1CNB7_9ACTN